jgi:hypothetical protein
MSSEKVYPAVKQIDKIKIGQKNDIDQIYVEHTETIQVDTMDDKGEVFATKYYHRNEKKMYDFPPHKDFLDAMKMLRKLVIDLCEFKGEWDKFNDYEVVGVSFSGMDDDDSAGVIITAFKTTERTGKKLLINTPFNLLNDPNYGDSEMLDEYCKKVRDEAYEYLGGKHAANPQLSLSFESVGDNFNISVTTDEQEEEIKQRVKKAKKKSGDVAELEEEKPSEEKTVDDLANSADGVTIDEFINAAGLNKDETEAPGSDDGSGEEDLRQNDNSDGPGDDEGEE